MNDLSTERIAKIAAVYRETRRYLDGFGFLEFYSLPSLSTLPNLDAEIDLFETSLSRRRGPFSTVYLSTSYEYYLKRLVLEGAEAVYNLAPVFRNGEMTRRHNPFFTMLEYYRAHVSWLEIMTSLETLVALLARQFAPMRKDMFGIPFERLSMARAFDRYAKVDLSRLLADKSYANKVMEEKSYAVLADDTVEDLYFKLYISDVEPHLGKDRPVFVAGYPLRFAVNAAASATDPTTAERFELYIDGIEIANGATECVSADEQLARFVSDKAAKDRRTGHDYPVDMELVELLRAHPVPMAGVAVGMERLLMALLGEPSIDNIIPFTMEQLIENR